MTRTASSASALQAAWNKLAPREQTLVSAAAAVVVIAEALLALGDLAGAQRGHLRGGQRRVARLGAQVRASVKIRSDRCWLEG